MAPTFDTLSDHDFDDVDEEEIDFSGKVFSGCRSSILSSVLTSW